MNAWESLQTAMKYCRENIKDLCLEQIQFEGGEPRGTKFNELKGFLSYADIYAISVTESLIKNTAVKVLSGK